MIIIASITRRGIAPTAKSALCVESNGFCSASTAAAILFPPLLGLILPVQFRKRSAFCFLSVLTLNSYNLRRVILLFRKSHCHHFYHLPFTDPPIAPDGFLNWGGQQWGSCQSTFQESVRENWKDLHRCYSCLYYEYRAIIWLADQSERCYKKAILTSNKWNPSKFIEYIRTFINSFFI